MLSGDVDGILSIFADDYFAEANTKEAFRERVELAIAQGLLEGISVDLSEAVVIRETGVMHRTAL